MTTAYEFAAGYTKLGVGTAPSSAPTITIVDSANNVLVAAATATTALSNLVGAYRYSYSGADGLICYALFHTTDASMDQQDLFAIPNVTADTLENGTDIDELIATVGAAGAGLSSIPNSSGVATMVADYARRTGDYSTLAAGAQMDLVAAPNATAVTAIQNGLSKPGTAQTITAPYSAADIATAVWAALTSALTVTNSIGKALVSMIADYARRTGDYSTYAGGDTSGVTTLLARIIGTLDTGTHKPQSGDAYAVANGRLPAALTANGNIKASLVEILTTALTETSGLLAGAFKKFFNVVTPTGTVNSLPDAAPQAAGGLVTSIVGSLDLDEMNADVEAIQTKTDQLVFTVANQVDANALTGGGGGSGLTAQQTRDAMKLAPTGGAADAGSIDDQLAEIEAGVDLAETGGWPTAAQIDTQLSGTHGAGLWGGAGGAGSKSCVLNVTVGGNPIDGANVWVTTDIGGSNVSASGFTDAFGNITFLLDPGTYYAWKQHSDYNFTNPESFVVT